MWHWSNSRVCHLNFVSIFFQTIILFQTRFCMKIFYIVTEDFNLFYFMLSIYFLWLFLMHYQRMVPAKYSSKLSRFSMHDSQKSVCHTGCWEHWKMPNVNFFHIVFSRIRLLKSSFSKIEKINYHIKMLRGDILYICIFDISYPAIVTDTLQRLEVRKKFLSQFHT